MLLVGAKLSWRWVWKTDGVLQRFVRCLSEEDLLLTKIILPIGCVSQCWRCFSRPTYWQLSTKSNFSQEVEWTNQISFLPQPEHKHSFNNDGGKYIDLGVQEARHDVFRGFCTINKKVCELIGDNYSSKNFVNRKRVEYFKLPMEIRHGSLPYKGVGAVW